MKTLIDEDLCTSCGTCFGICPQDAIYITKNEQKGTFVPYINEEKCTDCGLCTRVCPGREVNFVKLNYRIFGRLPENVLLGNYIACYIGYATNFKTRFNAASGGVVTAILSFLLEKKIINGALITKMKSFSKPESLIARDVVSLLTAQGSIYMPTLTNKAVKYIIEHKGKYAVVGLPCHIEGLRKAEQVIRVLKERILIHIGLFCGGNINLLGTYFAFRKRGIDVRRIKNVKYRGNGWPGYITVLLENGSKVRIPYLEFWSTVYPFFLPVRCVLCLDVTNELSDVSCGDAWLPKILKRDRLGTSIIVTRTRKGDEIVRQAIENGYIKAIEVDASEVIKSQGAGLIQRKVDSLSRQHMFKKLSLSVPRYVYPYFHFSLLSFLRTFILYLKLLSSHYRLYRLIELYSIISRAYFYRQHYL